MAGIFSGLELAKRALLSHQYTLNTIGHNVANAATPGYSRQRVGLVAGDPLRSGAGLIGTGVNIAWVRQSRDLFLTTQYRQENDQLGQWSSTERAMTAVESIFQEPSELGLNSVLSEFFAAWHTLSQNPESSASRVAVLEQTTTLVNTFHQLSRRLSDLERSLDQEVAGKVSQVNQMSSELAGLNRDISRQELSGSSANDLRDRRDLLIDQLSSLVNVNVLENGQGSTRIFLGSMEIVGGTSYTELSTKTVSAGTQSRTTIVWKSSTLTVNIKGGSMSGLIDARDNLIPQFRAMLDELAGGLVAQINSLHTAGTGLDGTTGNEFFAPGGVTAATIGLDNSVLGDLNKIAASQAGAVGDNSNAIAIANLQNALVLNNSTTTFSDHYAKLISSVGRRSAEAMDARSNAALVVEQIEFSRQSVQGVSLDEEMIELIKAQHAYDAAARVLTTVDHALDTLMGLIR